MNKKWICNYCHKETKITKANESYARCPKCGMERELLVTPSVTRTQHINEVNALRSQNKLK